MDLGIPCPGFRHLHVWTSAGQFDPRPAKQLAAPNRLNRLDHGEEVQGVKAVLEVLTSEVAHFEDGYLAAPLGNGLSTENLSGRIWQFPVRGSYCPQIVASFASLCFMNSAYDKNNKRLSWVQSACPHSTAPLAHHHTPHSSPPCCGYRHDRCYE